MWTVRLAPAVGDTVEQYQTVPALYSSSRLHPVEWLCSIIRAGLGPLLSPAQRTAVELAMCLACDRSACADVA
jgi:hypothetical protein